MKEGGGERRICKQRSTLNVAYFYIHSYHVRYEQLCVSVLLAYCTETVAGQRLCVLFISRNEERNAGQPHLLHPLRRAKGLTPSANIPTPS